MPSGTLCVKSYIVPQRQEGPQPSKGIQVRLALFGQIDSRPDLRSSTTAFQPRRLIIVQPPTAASAG
jgi:hypothetical protein